MSGLGVMMLGGNPDKERGRSENDFYPTPVEVTEALCRRYDFTEKAIWEPCAGNGAMGDVLKRYCPRVGESDISPRKEGMLVRDFLKANVPMGQNIAIITNPPFKLAEKMIRHAWIDLQVPFLALVLKSTFWHSVRRQKLWNECRPHAVHPLTWRPDFMELGRPTMEVMWCVWERHTAYRPVIYEPMNKPAR